ncbi:MAG: hypothetical protein CMH50_02945, partial [Myxococcales bacterium]|nr:hypothetical protein [Myxococcales bacterium]
MTTEEIDISDIPYSGEEIFRRVSVRYRENPSFEMQEDVLSEYNSFHTSGKSAIGKTIFKSKSNNILSFASISSKDELEKMIEDVFYSETLKVEDHWLRELHECTMYLSKKFYEPYREWRNVGVALHNSDDRCFLTWMLFSSKSEKFDFADLPGYWEEWCDKMTAGRGLSHRSIHWWLKEESPEIYEKVKQKSTDYYVDMTINPDAKTGICRSNDYDIASVLHALYKDKYVCVSVKQNAWYKFENHRWIEDDCGTTLRQSLSTDISAAYSKKVSQLMPLMYTTLPPGQGITGSSATDEDQAKQNKTRSIINNCINIIDRCKKTSTKDSIMREAREIFYQRNFIQKLDQNPLLLGFDNGVIDFETKEFRKGKPSDFISLSTNRNYVPIDRNNDEHNDVLKQISDFMSQLFPNESLKKYMWQHLSSTLLGTNENQTFNMYTGKGSNGKSILVKLMEIVLGDYKGTVPITLITQGRNKIGSASPETAQLKGKRYAVMQEPSKGDRINEGIMKELTGGDPIQARSLFKDAITFIPQFSLVVCCNVMLDITSNDDGTWRRVRVCPFKSKFTKTPVSDDPDSPHQFKIDPQLEKKFTQWAPIFVSRLIEIVFERGGVVDDCDIVMAASDKYREGQDYLTQFVNEKIEAAEGKKVKKTELTEVFRTWYVEQFGGGKGKPKAREIYEFMDKKYGKFKKGWHNIKIIYDDDDDEDEEEQVEKLKNQIIELKKIPQPEQRTPEWYTFRNNRLTASDLGTIIGQNPYENYNSIIQKKCGLEKPFKTNKHIQRGVKYEDVIIKIYEYRNNVKVFEYGCIPHPDIAHFGASPDGIVDSISINKDYIGRMLEIKCPGSRPITGFCPDYYHAQVQGQLEVCD